MVLERGSICNTSTEDGDLNLWTFCISICVSYIIERDGKRLDLIRTRHLIRLRLRFDSKLDITRAKTEPNARCVQMTTTVTPSHHHLIKAEMTEIPYIPHRRAMEVTKLTSVKVKLRGGPHGFVKLSPKGLKLLSGFGRQFGFTVDPYDDEDTRDADRRDTERSNSANLDRKESAKDIEYKEHDPNA
jgi:hypothetical protein